jgi:tetratricopeptide (TPR) repeat protein
MLHQPIALAWQLLESGNIAAAETAVRPLLAHGMRDELVPLIAALRSRQERWSEAAPLLERARILHPREARFAYLHGMALASMDRLVEAVPAFQAAIKQEPNVAAAYLALGNAQRRLGHFQDAQHTFRKLLRIHPDNAEGYVFLSAALAEADGLAAAEAPLRRALLHTQDAKIQAVIHNNMAASLEWQSRDDEALESLNRVQTVAPDWPDLDNRRIGILYRLGRFDDCLFLYGKLLDRHPRDTQIHHAYNSLLYRLGRMDAYLKSYDLAPPTRELMLGKAGFLMMERRSAEAQAVYGELLARDDQDIAAAAGLANSLMQTGRYAESVAAYDAVTGRPGADAAVFSGAAEAAMMAGDAQKAEFFCQEGLRHSPHDQMCLALLGLSWRLQGDARDEVLNGYDSLIRSFDLEPPDGFSSMEDFNTEFGAYLEHQHPKTRAYLEQSLHNGTQTEGFLFGTGHRLIQTLKARIDEAVGRFIADLPSDAHHPFMARRARTFRYVGAWSSLMRDQGFHKNHLHPQGWISSCYYVAVPEVARDPDAKQGWIKFGEPAVPVALGNAVRRAIQPVPGRLVLFPSYMWHGTVPFHAPALRTTIAFDVVPQE